MKINKFLRYNGLSIVLLLLFIVTQFGLTVAGWYQHNEEQKIHGVPTQPYTEYLSSSQLLETTMENWESEFLQMYLFVVLTTHLYQKGSAASKKPDEENEVDEDPRLSSHLPNVRSGEAGRLGAANI